MHDCAFCGSTDVELVTATLAERQGAVAILAEGVPAVRCRACDEGGDPAVTLELARAFQAASELVFAATSDSQRLLATVAAQETTR